MQEHQIALLLTKEMVILLASTFFSSCLTLVTIGVSPVYLLGSGLQGDVTGKVATKSSVALSKVSVNNEDDVSSWYENENYYYNLTNYDHALVWYQKVLDADPQDFESWVGKADSLYKLARYDEALTSYEKALEIDPQDFDSWIGKGSSLYILERYNESLAAFEKGLEIDPQNSYAWYDRGNALYRLGEYDEAVHQRPSL